MRVVKSGYSLLWRRVVTW